MNSLKGAVLAVVTLGVLAAGAAGLAWAGLREPTGGQKGRSSPGVTRPAAGDDEPRPEAPKARDTADIRGSWEVLYVAGTVAGKREGYPMPGLVVPITDKTINFPALTGNPKDPMKYLGAMSYTLQPGLKEADEQVEAAEEQLKWLRLAFPRDRAVRAQRSLFPRPR